MDTRGLDLHKRETQVCILEKNGGIVERRISTTRERFTAVLGSQPPPRILVEASTACETEVQFGASLPIQIQHAPTMRTRHANHIRARTEA